MIKAIFGYDIDPRQGCGDHDGQPGELRVPGRLANPHLAGLVVNSVCAAIRGTHRYDRIAELHFPDRDAFDRYREWDAAHTTAANGATTGRVHLAFGVLTDTVDVDRDRMTELIADPRARVSTRYPQPGAKAILGYQIVSGVTLEAYDRWLWDVHVADLLVNPHLQRIVFNTVIQNLTAGPTFFRISELHFADLRAHAQFERWRARNPVPVERGPGGRTDFKFYLLAAVHSALPRERAPFQG